MPAAGAPGDTGWVYRSNAPAEPLPDIDVRPVTPPQAVDPPPASLSMPRFVQAMDWLSMPFQIMLLMGLTPLRRR